MLHLLLRVGEERHLRSPADRLGSLEGQRSLTREHLLTVVVGMEGPRLRSLVVDLVCRRPLILVARLVGRRLGSRVRTRIKVGILDNNRAMGMGIMGTIMDMVLLLLLRSLVRLVGGEVEVIWVTGGSSSDGRRVKVRVNEWKE